MRSAAALKQVPALEYNPMEAVYTNVLGADNIVEAAVDSGVTTVIAMSTDKAVSPTNVMGATKRLAEQVLQAPTCVADPSYCSNNMQCSADPSVTNPVGCPGFRSDAVRILIEVTDAGNQAGPGPQDRHQQDDRVQPGGGTGRL